MRLAVKWGAMTIALTAMALFTGPSARGAQDPKPLADEKTGIEVGEKAPAFTLKGQDGEEYSLDDLLKKGNVALVFYRSARW